jgi:hypothetical protein
MQAISKTMGSCRVLNSWDRSNRNKGKIVSRVRVIMLKLRNLLYKRMRMTKKKMTIWSFLITMEVHRITMR